MKNIVLRYLFVICFALSPSIIWANGQEVMMSEILMKDGKIYVVLSVILTILFGLIGYLIYLDSKISNLEKDLNK
tara:strand:+ start:12 stop:236 length:225 start_codon:yes stop_codon:yes gene_type:complete